VGVVGAFIAETFIELSPDGGIRAQAEPAIRAGGALLERVNQQAANAAAACGGQHVEVSKPSGRRVGDIGIRRNPAEAEEAKIESTQEEFARRVARDSGAATWLQDSGLRALHRRGSKSFGVRWAWWLDTYNCAGAQAGEATVSRA